MPLATAEKAKGPQPWRDASLENWRGVRDSNKWSVHLLTAV